MSSQEPRCVNCGRLLVMGRRMLVHRLEDFDRNLPIDCFSPASAPEDGCYAQHNDGDCVWVGCPQLRDGEPKATGRHCPRDTGDDDE